VWLRISDNGCGFPEAIIKGAFEPYVTTKAQGNGAGARDRQAHHRRAPRDGDDRERTGKEGGRGAAVRISLPLAA